MNDKSSSMSIKSLENFKVYQCSAELLAFVSKILDSLPRGNGAIADQLRRSSLSIPLNIAEGAGKTSPIDKRRFYAIARGSTLETFALLDACLRLKLIEKQTFLEGREKLHEIAAMLTRLTTSTNVRGPTR